MTRIDLKNNFYIEVNKKNYTLKQEYIGRTAEGKEKKASRTCGYHGKIRHAIEQYMRLTQLDVMDGERLSLEEYVEIVEKSNKIALQGLEHILERFPIK